MSTSTRRKNGLMRRTHRAQVTSHQLINSGWILPASQPSFYCKPDTTLISSSLSANMRVQLQSCKRGKHDATNGRQRRKCANYGRCCSLIHRTETCWNLEHFQVRNDLGGKNGGKKRKKKKLSGRDWRCDTTSRGGEGRSCIYVTHTGANINRSTWDIRMHQRPAFDCTRGQHFPRFSGFLARVSTSPRDLSFSGFFSLA